MSKNKLTLMVVGTVFDGLVLIFLWCLAVWRFVVGDYDTGCLAFIAHAVYSLDVRAGATFGIYVNTREAIFPSLTDASLTKDFEK